MIVSHIWTCIIDKMSLSNELYNYAKIIINYDCKILKYKDFVIENKITWKDYMNHEK